MTEEVCDSWEDLLEQESTVKEVPKDKLKNDNQSKLNKKKKSNDSVKIINSNKNIQISFEDSTRTQFILPQIQQQQQNLKVKILQRPKIDNEITNSSSNSQKLDNIRSIQEREAAYAKARERILGKDYENDEEINVEVNQQLEKKDDNLIRMPNGPNLNSNFLTRK